MNSHSNSKTDVLQPKADLAVGAEIFPLRQPCFKNLGLTAKK